MPSSRLNLAIRRLSESGASLRCDELRDLLVGLGFSIKDGKKVGHKVVTHGGLAGFHSTSYTCGHGHNPEIKRSYLNNIRRVLQTHEQALQDFLKEEAP
jgi:hypothetical protein